MESANRIRLVIESRFENIFLIGGAVRGIAATLAFDETICYHLELCVVEAVNNTLKHAYDCEPGHSVEVEILIHQDRIIFKIRDTGKSMHAGKVEPLQFEPGNVESVPERGMGRFIMDALMDEVSYETVNGRNILSMTKFLKREEQSS
jgi:serine/threonine-protein kinase RsbW